jgi:hypothetical protein
MFNRDGRHPISRKTSTVIRLFSVRSSIAVLRNPKQDLRADLKQPEATA